MAIATTLSGISVLVTRPSHQTANFCQLLTHQGAQAVCLPVIEIQFGGYDKAQLVACSSNAQLIVFTSANAVAGAHYLQPLPWSLAKHTRLAAIGHATALALKKHNMQVDVVPANGSTSEHLLQLIMQPGIPVGDVTIVRGDSGRDKLRDTLVSSGATVRYLEVYRRRCPKTPKSRIVGALKLLKLHNKLAIVCVSSDFGLYNLLAMVPANLHRQLFQYPLVVNSERCALIARDAGFKTPIEIAQPPGDAGQLDAIHRIANSHI